MERLLKDYRTCAECGAHVSQEDEHCSSCGAYVLGLGDYLRRRGSLLTFSPAIIAVFTVFALPDYGSRYLTSGEHALLEMGLLGVGLLPFLTVLATFMWRRGQRSHDAYGPRAEALQDRLDAVEEDVTATEVRIRSARVELERARGSVAAADLRRELAQDERLLAAQERMADEVRARLESIHIQQWREELGYYEACRDARISAPDVAAELADRIHHRRNSLAQQSDSWDQVLEEAASLHRQLARGIPRLLAAAKLEPLHFAGEVDDTANPAPPGSAGLDDDTHEQLERIERSFDALDDLAAELSDPAQKDESGIRMRVDEEVGAGGAEAEALAGGSSLAFSKETSQG